MAHRITLELQTKVVLHKDVTFEVATTGGGKLGELLVSKGNKRRLSWTSFAELMEREGKLVKVRKPTKGVKAV